MAGTSTGSQRATRRLLPLMTLTSLMALTAPARAGAASPATAATPTPTATPPPCSTIWTGGGKNNSWDNPANWFLHKVPGPSSDVCISTFVFIFATGNIEIHSLQLGEESSLDLGETATVPVPSTLDATGFIDNQGNLGVYDSTLESPRITSTNGIEGGSGQSTITSAHFSNSGDVAAISGTLKVTDFPIQLSAGTLAGGQWDAFANATLKLPGPITDLAAGQVGIEGSGVITSAGANALSGLDTIGTDGTLALAGNKPLNFSGGLTSAGALQLGSYDQSGTVKIAGTYTEQSGASTSLSAADLQASAIILDPGSSLSGSGTVTGDVDNSGSVAAGGSLGITGNYTQTGGATLGAGDGPSLAVSGSATLAGTLDIPANVPPPAPGTKSTAMTFASRTGGFTGHTIGFRVNAGTTQIDVVAEPQVAVSPRPVAPGATLAVNGGDFPYDSTVDVYIDAVGTTPLATASVDIHGFFAASVTVPATTGAGAHTLIAVDRTTRVSTGFQVS